MNEDTVTGVKEFLVATCYATILLNLGATICSFVIIDHLGGIGFEAAAIRDPEDDRLMGQIRTTQTKLLMKFGASNQLEVMQYHCQWHLIPSQYVAFLPFIPRANHLLPRHTHFDYCSPHLRGYGGFKTDQNCHEPHRCIHPVAYDILLFLEAFIRIIEKGSHLRSIRDTDGGARLRCKFNHGPTNAGASSTVYT